LTLKNLIRPCPYRTQIPTSFGVLHLFWEETMDKAAVTHIYLPGRHPAKAVRDAVPFVKPNLITSREISRLWDDMQDFLMGKEVSFDLGMIALDRCTDFQKRVLIAEHSIPRGRVSTYGRIAAHVGVHGAARAVGRVLATHPFPVIIPSHRAVQADGRLGGYQGGLDMKRRLLAFEGVAVSADGRVLMDAFYY